MTNWQRHWNEFPAQLDKADFLTQVGHTINGRPYSDEVFRQMTTGITRALALNENDRLLDLCCGNGIITEQLAVQCAAVVGMDFSRPLLDIAVREHNPKNVVYKYMDVTELSELNADEFAPFTKVLMYGSLQHLDHHILPLLLSSILRLCCRAPRILFGGVPNRYRRSRFLDSTEKSVKYFWRRLNGRDRIGYWWRPEDIENACKQLGLSCSLDMDSSDRPGAEYRFDAIITREDG